MTIQVPAAVMEIASRLNRVNEKVYVVGGSVRDMLMGLVPHDYDLATTAMPEKVMQTFEKVIPTGIQHGTVTVMIDKVGYEVTTLRGDGTYSDGRHPDSVSFIRDITEDLARRDFTINAIAYDPFSNEIIDPFKGQDDIRYMTIRAVRNAEDRFNEDGLRIMRAIRFCARLEFAINIDTYLAIKACKDMIRKVSVERIRDEFVKILSAPDPRYALIAMVDTGIMEITLPEAMPMVGCGQNHYHDFDVYEHTIRVVNNVPPSDILVRVAAFFHDIGKPRAKVFDERRGEHAFSGHDDISAEMATEIMTRMKFSNEEIDFVVNLVKNHMPGFTPRFSDAAVRRLIRRVGKENVDALMVLCRADLNATRANNLPDKDRDDMDVMVQRVNQQKNFTVINTSVLPVDGNDVMTILSIKPGKKVGEVLQNLLEEVTDNPDSNSREVLLERIKAFI